MKYSLSELLYLEVQGQYSDALKLIENNRSDFIQGNSLNLELLEKRLHQRIGITTVSIDKINPSKKKPSDNTAAEIKKDQSWSAIITLWKRVDYLKEQISAIKKQTIPPVEIIVILNESHISEEIIKSIDENIQIIKSDINSLYSRWALAYIVKGHYISVFDDDVIPGDLWIANAMRACKKYNALVGANGRIYNSQGNHDFYELVTPYVGFEEDKSLNCRETDIYCDWVCNSYFFMRDWVPYALGNKRYKDSLKTFDDIQLATSLYLNGGIQCITPMQPKNNKRLHASLQDEYGNDAHAIWKTNSEKHFLERREYINELIASGYVPVRGRDELYRFHLIIPFGDRQYLERCLLSVKGQKYQNYTCTLIDDCHDGKNSLSILEQLNVDKKQYKYIKAKEKLYPLRAREIATDLLDANISDVVIHLDGDDWLPNPSVLSKLNEVYRSGNIAVTYGNTVVAHDFHSHDFKSYSTHAVSKRWNVMQSELEAESFPMRKLSCSEVNMDWRTAPWNAMHLRTFQFVKWAGVDRVHFTNKNGEYHRVATDAAILLPILNNTKFTSIKFIRRVMYVYQNSSNTIHAKKEIVSELKRESLAIIKNANFDINYKAINELLIDSKGIINYTEVETVRSYHHAPSPSLPKLRSNIDSAVITIVTPNYLADAILCLKSYQLNVQIKCKLYIFLATSDKKEISSCSDIVSKLNIHLLDPNILKNTKEFSNKFSDKYSFNSDEYRWGMKSVMLLELLALGHAMVLFLDPDTYTVSDVTDIHEKMLQANISLFPHFRDPDNNYLRKILYKDGFFNGGMIAVTKGNECHIKRLYERCLQVMEKNPEQHRWDDQKYFDLFVVELSSLFINMDRGIDYNPWNYEPVEGIISPSQRSYLLKSGYFVRHWHVSTTMINHSISRKEKRYDIYRPVVAIYLLTLLQIILLVVYFLRRGERDINIIGLNNRFESIVEKVRGLSSNISVDEIVIIFDSVQNQRQPMKIADFAKKWSDLVSKSILFDNIELFHTLLTSFFPGKGIENVVAFLRSIDLNDEEHKLNDIGFEYSDAGSILAGNLQFLQKNNIDY